MHNHTNCFSGHFRGKPGLAGFLDFRSPLVSGPESIQVSTKLFICPLTQYHQVFLGHPLCLVPSKYFSELCIIPPLFQSKSTHPSDHVLYFISV